MKKEFHSLSIVIPLFFLSFMLEAQPYVNNSEAFKELDKAKLYVVMSNEKGENNDYADVFKEVWKYCPYEIIEGKDVVDFMHKGAYFMYMTVNFFGKNPDKIEYKRITKYGIAYELSIYTPSDECLKNLQNNPDKNKLLEKNENFRFVGSIQLKPDDSKIFNMKAPFKTDFMGKGYILSSGPGILKNYLQFFQKSLEEKLYLYKWDEHYNVNEIKRLKTNTLYVPEELLKGYAHKGDDPENEYENEYDMVEIAEKAEYPGKYKVISMDSLNQLIMNSEEVFYYVSLYSGLNDRTAMNAMTVTNAITGEIIYKEVSVTNKSFSPNIFKDLSKKINKANN